MPRRSRSRVLLGAVMRPHSELAAELMRRSPRKKRRRGTSPTTREVAVIVFLAGLDKLLGLALQLLYLAGKVDLGWLHEGGRRADRLAGVLSCSPGLGAKINKLQSLGLDLSDLRWLVELRNRYVHSCSIDVRYKVSISDDEESRLSLRATGPEVSTVGEFAAGVTERHLRAWATGLISRIARFVEEKGGDAAWVALSREVRNLPVDPEPALDRVVAADDYGELADVVEALNNEKIGVGLVRLPSVARRLSGSPRA